MDSQAATPNVELQTLLHFTRRLPKMRGAGAIGNIFKNFYLRKQRTDVLTDVLDFKMRLNPSEMVDSGLLFFPQVYDHKEIAYLRAHLSPGDTFLDIGANIGFYSLVASRKVGEAGLVLAIEADPFSHRRLCDNLALNAAHNVRALNIGVSDRAETLRLGINADGNRGESSFLSQSETGVEVPCDTLAKILRAQGIEKVKGAKFDIEGFEFRVLKQFFNEAEESVYPEFIVIEHNPVWHSRAGGDAINLLQEHGYRPAHASRLNYIMTR